MNLQTLFLTFSTILNVIAPITYAVSILKGKTKPHRMTRFIVFFVLALNFLSIVAAHGNMGAIVFAGISSAQATVIFILSLWRGMGGIHRFDLACLVIAAVGILGWKLTGNPVIGVWFSILADFAAYLPAFVKTWHHPHTESPWYFLLGAVASFLSLIAYKIETVSIFQIYIIVTSLVMVGFIYRKKLIYITGN